MISRRKVLSSALAVAGYSLLPHAYGSDLKKDLTSSDLIYLTAIKSDGGLSQCQSEIWFVYDGVDIFICTGTSSWRATAPILGLDHAKIWVGDLGNWKNSKGKYQALPSLMATATIEKDEDVKEKVLKLYGDKYPLSWLLWESKFREGLSDGSRTILRYHPV